MMKMPNLNDLKIKIFADTANWSDIFSLSKHPLIKGFTTNPSLMHKVGIIKNYEEFGKRCASYLDPYPISLEVFADDYPGMIRQAQRISSWGDNIYVKIPIINTQGEFNGLTISTLLREDIKINVTGIFTPHQIYSIRPCLNSTTPIILSIFAGRIADTGVNPLDIINRIQEYLNISPNTELLWASCREVYNIFQAYEAGCQIITVTPDIIYNKLTLIGKDLTEYSLETVQQFYNDALEAGFEL